MKKEIVALVPVKASSERVRNKNTRPFHDTNLFELKLHQLKDVKGFSNITISSEDERLLKIAIDNGYDVHHRDPKYSTSTVPMSEVYSYIASEIKGEHIAWVNVTNPLAESKVYDGAIEIYEDMDSNFDCLLSAYEVKEYLFHNGRPVNFKPNPWPKSQDLSGVCAISFVINILKREDMVKWGSCVGQKPYFYFLDPVTSTDVDFQWNFDFCEMIYRERLNKK
jgi:CMP-N-acetylneuraminic acid synthetase